MEKPLQGVVLTILYFLLSTSHLKGQTAQFAVTAEGGNFCAPAKISFVPTFSEKPEYFFWNFGQNGEESEINSPVVTYLTPGIYQVKLTVVFQNVVREVINNVSVFGPSGLDIQSQKEFLCKPGNNIFTLGTNDTLSRLSWKMGNGNTIVNNQNVPVQFTFPDFGSYDISVEVEDRRGCKAIATDVFRVEKLKAAIADTAVNGCLPVNVKFTANILVPAGTSVTRYTWNFDDGSSPGTTAVNNINHTYSGAGTFRPSLSVITGEGCENTFTLPPVEVGTAPVLSRLTYTNDTLCASEVLSVTAFASTANRYLYEISDGTFYESLNGRIFHRFKSLGNFKVKVTPINNGCPGVTSSFDVLVRGVIANYSAVNSCAQKNRFTFRSTSIGTVNSMQWNFEGSASPVTLPNPEFTFPEQGKYSVSLVVRNNSTGCTDTAAGFVYTAKPKLEPTDTFVCLGSPVNMQVVESYTNPRTTYNWNFVGKILNNTTDSAIRLNADAEGLFTNRVIIFNGTGYCRDTLIHPMKIRVAGLNPAFETIAANCTYEDIVIKNTTTSLFGISPDTKWTWDFDNGISSDLRNPPPAIYTRPGTVRISLTVADGKGCVDSIRKVIRIRRKPPLKVSPKEQKVCQAQEITLTAFHTSGVTWSPSNLVDCDTCSMVKVKPMLPTEYQVITKDSFNCSALDTIKLDVWYPFELEPNLIRDTAVCFGDSVRYDLKTTGKIVSWSPVAGLSSGSIPDPLAKPEITTTYIATVTDSARCFVRTDTSVLTINPLPVIDHDSLLIVPFEETFTITPKYSNDIKTYNWIATSQLSCLDCPNPSGKATNPALFELKVVSDKGCSNAAAINLVIDCSSKNIYMPSAFSPDKNGLNDYYYPLTRGIRRVKRFAVFNRFGEIVFERRDFIPNNRSDGWDGTFKGKVQPPGIYTYWVELLCASGNLQHYKGSFVLIK